MMGAEMVTETLVSFDQLMLQIAREDFVEISGRESFKSNSQHV
jgi:hypothetical protein